MADSGGGRTCGICKRALRGDDEWIALDGGDVWCAECWGIRFGGGTAAFAAASDSNAEANVGELTLADLEAESRHAPDPMEDLSARMVQQAEDALMADMAAPADAPAHPEFAAVSGTRPPSAAQSHAAATHAFQWFPLRRSLDEFGRERGVLWGIALLIGSLLPMIVPDGSGGERLHLVFPLAELGGAPASAQFLCFSPLLAGIAMILLALFTGGKGRGVGMLTVWAVPGVVLLGSLAELGPQGLTGLADLVASFAVGQILAAVWLLMLAWLVLAGMCAGLLVLRARPTSKFGRLTAGLCGAVFLLLSVMPVVPAAFAPFVGSLPIASPFHIMGMNALLGFVAVITLASLLTVAALSAACLSPKHHPLVPRVAIAVLWGTMVFAPTLSCVVMAYHLASMTQGAIAPGAVSMVMPIVHAPKFAAIFYGLWAPLVLGLIELYAAFAAMRAAPASSVASSNRVAALPSEEELSIDGLEARGRLEDLKKLKDANLISELDYEVKKRDLLKRFRP